MSSMRSPLRPVPDRVMRWTYALRALRWLDALGAWLLLWTLGALLMPDASTPALAMLAAGALGVARLSPGARVRWRPVSGAVSLAVSASLRPGDRAWYVRSDEAEVVVVTGRRGLRLVIATPGRGGAEGISVRRTRVFVIPVK